MSQHEKDVIKKFVLKQCQLLRNEEEVQRLKVLSSPSFSAEAVNSLYDQDIGWIIEFSGVSQEKLRIGSWLVSMTNDRAIVSSVSPQGFSLAVMSKDLFPVGDVFFFRLLYIKPLLQSAILDILDNSVYTRGHASRRVRDILLGLSKPRNSSKKEKINFLNPNLNESQRKAVERSLEQEELSIIHGPPGTGKTTILVEVIQQYRKIGKRILVCSASHVAVDNVMEKLIARSGGLGMVRVGHPVKVRRGHIKYTLDVKTRKNEGENIEKLKEASIVFGTLTGVVSTKGMKKLPQGFFDLTVVDECAQALEAAVWAVVRFTSKLLLAGDHLQLPPTVLSNDPSVKTALSVSLMERLVSLYNDPVVSLLDTQYRMTSTIMNWSSNTFYGGKLKAASSAASRTLFQLHGVKDSKITKQEIVLVDTKGTMVQQNSTIQQESAISHQFSLANLGEASIVLATVRELTRMGVRPQYIGVITYYALQADHLRKNLSSTYPAVEIHTVDGFQGREKEVIIVSTVRSNTEGKIGFLKEHRRLNVAVTRARRKLVIVADRNTFSRDTVWKSLFDYIENNGEVCENTTSNIADRMATLNLEDTRNGSGDGKRKKDTLDLQPSWRQYRVKSGYVMGGCGWVANFRQGWERQANFAHDQGMYGHFRQYQGMYGNFGQDQRMYGNFGQHQRMHRNFVQNQGMFGNFRQNPVMYGNFRHDKGMFPNFRQDGRYFNNINQGWGKFCESRQW